MNISAVFILSALLVCVLDIALAPSVCQNTCHLMTTLITCEQSSCGFPSDATTILRRRTTTWMRPGLQWRRRRPGCDLGYNGGEPHFVGDDFASLAKTTDDSDGEKDIQVDQHLQGAAHVRKFNVVSRILFTYLLKDNATHD